LRVTMNAVPLSNARMIRPVWLRNSRCVIRRFIPRLLHTCYEPWELDRFGSWAFEKAMRVVLIGVAARSRGMVLPKKRGRK
jgi:hypothetical protein